MNKERIVIVGYKPKEGKKEALKNLLTNHVERLRKEGLASDRDSIICEAQNGTFIEIFGWESKEAIEAAHQNPEVQLMWQEFAEVCEYVPAGDVAEMSNLFSEFWPL